MIIKYTHPDLGEDVQGRAGFYTAVEESTMPYKGREVLYVMGTARLDRPCCGGACGWGYIQVPGFLVRKRLPAGEGPAPVSEVEIIEDEEDREQIRQALMEKHRCTQVEVWGMHYAQDDSPRTSVGPAG